MVWDGIKRRAHDAGEEGPEVVLARIDERLKSMNEKFTVHIDNFNKHVTEDEGSFKNLRDQIGKHAIYIYMGLGGVAVISAIFNLHK